MKREMQAAVLAGLLVVALALHTLRLTLLAPPQPGPAPAPELAAAAPEIELFGDGPPAELDNFGWLGPEAELDAKELLAAELDDFEVLWGAEAEDLAGKQLGLWQFVKVATANRDHLPNRRQEIGDCVSFGFGHACEYSLAVNQMVAKEGKFRRVFKPFLYGAGRVLVGNVRSRGNGSTGAWQAAALERYGVLAEDDPGVPSYSGSVAMKWGGPPGPPEEFLRVAKTRSCQTKRIRDWDAAVVALSNGWPVAICSSVGFCRIVEANGRVEGRATCSWAHCMCLIGFDTRPGTAACYCLNSWGPSAHAPAERYAALDGAPPGGFWMLKSDVERVLRAGDSYAVSFNGFEFQDLFALLEQDDPAHVDPLASASVPVLALFLPDPLGLEFAGLGSAASAGLFRRAAGHGQAHGRAALRAQ